MPAVSARTVRRILPAVDRQPPRPRYWKTSRLNDQLKRRAEPILWGYGNAQRLADQGWWIVGTDEMPNCQGLERHPIRRALPGRIEHQEFEYQRHGTVTILGFLGVHPGLMEAVILERQDAAHYVQALKQCRQRHPPLHGVFLIQDGDPSHTAHATRTYWARIAWWRSRYTPVHAAWLNQAAILIHLFRHRYLKRQSWKTRNEYIDHVMASWPEYNCRYARPIEWTWTKHKMRQWFKTHAR